MRAPAVDRRESDSPLGFALAWTGAVAFLLFVTRDPPDPGLLLPVAIAALPYAAAPRHRIAFRILAAALLLGFLAVRGPGLGSLVFAPAVGALLLSAYQQAQGTVRMGRSRSPRGRRSRRG